MKFKFKIRLRRISYFTQPPSYGPLVRYVKLRVAHAPGMLGTFSPPPWVSDPDMHPSTCVTHVLWCMPGSLTSGFLWSRWRGKHSRHSPRMRNPQFYVFGKMPMDHITRPHSCRQWYCRWRRCFGQQCLCIPPCHSLKRVFLPKPPVKKQRKYSNKLWASIWYFLIFFLSSSWASHQIRKIVGCVYAGNAGSIFPATDFKGNH